MDALSAQSITSKTIIISVDTKKVGNRKKVRPSLVKVTAKDNLDDDEVSSVDTEETDGEINQDMLHVSKDLLSSPELEEIKVLFGKVNRFLRRKSLPTKTLKSGMYMLALSEVLAVDNEMDRFRSELQPLVEKFCNVYPQKVQESMANLGAIADPRDYPSVETIRDFFQINWQYLTFDVPKKTLGEISTVILQREEEKIQAQYAGFSEQIESAFIVALTEKVNHFLEVLQPQDGKKRKITEKGVDRFNKFMSDIMGKNVTENAQLSELMHQAREIMNGATPQEINRNADLKQTIAQKMNDVKNALNALIVEKGSRKVVLEPEEEQTTTVTGGSYDGISAQ